MKLHTALTAALLTAAIPGALMSAPAHAGTDPYIGEIIIVGESWCPRGWEALNGQLMQISQNTALFSLLGTRYGGDGVHTFALPDMRGRSPVGFGGTVALAQTGGAESVTLSTQQMPAHGHQLNASERAGAHTSPAGNDLAEFSVGGNMINAYASTVPGTVAMAPNAVGATGTGQAFSVRQPFLGVNYCIAVIGQFPVRQ